MSPIVAVCVHVVLQSGAVALGWRAAGSSGKRHWIMAAGVLLLATSLLLADGSLLLAMLPIRDLALVGNQTPLAAGLLAGTVAGTLSLARWRRLATALIFLIIADGAVLLPLVQRPPVTASQWVDGVCLQSTESTCAPAAAATLLRLHGIEADETSMATWCLTTDAGTTHWGLWRGLRALSDDSGWMVQAGDPGIEAVLSGPPAIVSVVLTRALDHREPRYRAEWGWLLGQPHAVVYLGPGKRPELIRIADPKIGIEEWNVQALRDLYNGQVYRLIRRSSP